jgi:hypothetical protein
VGGAAGDGGDAQTFPGAGGNGGSGIATGGAGGDGGTSDDFVGGEGGDGGTGGSTGGPGGTGGDGTFGGGSGGDGGNGGNTGGAGGAAGNGPIFGSNGTDGSVVIAPVLPAEPCNGSEGANGADGDINLVVNGEVGGNLTLNAGDGDIDATLNNGAAVGGTITANDDSNASLTFNLSTNSKKDYNKALAALIPANASGGSFSFNGQTYTWANFDDLVNQITLLAQQQQAEESARSGGGSMTIWHNVDDDGAPVDIYSVNGIVRLTHPNSGATLLNYDPADLPAPADGPILVQTIGLTLGGVEITVYLYLLPNGMLQLIAGDYTFAWTP